MTQDELNKLAHSLSFNFAQSVLFSDGITMRDAEGDAWQAVDAEGEALEEVDSLFDCLRYLEARGLLERHPEHNDWVRVRDESEAK